MRRCSFFYDDLSRLSEARYTDTVVENTGRYNTSYSYDKHGNLQSLRRNGMQDGGSYGIVDDLYYEYDSNRLCKVSNAAESPCYKGSMHFTDGADEETEYDYDADGNLIEDKNKDITRITYNVLNLPEHLDFKSGKYVNFTYSSTGEKLCSNYLLKLPEIYDPGTRSVSSDIFASGKFPPEWSEPVGPGLRDSLISRPDSMFTEEHYAMMYGAHIIEYCGDILYEDVNPVPNLILIDGGYVTFTNNKQPVYHFYLTDHQGNVRVVADEDGTVEETNHYYPFGALLGESAENNKQRYKYNGKELDRLLSLDWYDYGARWYDPVLARWHSVDPLADKYPDVSPYVYCNNNAVNKIDPDGKDDYYTNFGTFLYSDDKPTDFIIIRNEFLYRQKQITNATWINPYIPINKANLSAEAYSNIFTDILSKMEGVNVKELHNGKVSVTVWENCGNLKAAQDQYDDAGLDGEALAQIGSYKGKQRLTTYIYPNGDKEKDIFSSRSNIQNLLGAHEYIEHFKNNIGDSDYSHLRIYKNMQKHPSWIRATQFYKKYMNYMYNTIKNRIK